MLTSIRYGEWALHRRIGSLCARYYRDHGVDVPLLSRLFRLEFARLATIPSDNREPEPDFGFIWRIDEVAIHSAELNKDGRLPVTVTLEWGHREHWSGNILIGVAD